MREGEPVDSVGSVTRLRPTGSGASYLLRLDDMCHTMRWDRMDQIEGRINELGIRPLLAVIPKNEDRSFHYSPPNERFWDRVRAWQAAGWSIGMHGYQHLYVSNQSGVCGTDPRSEFAGVAEAEQRRKLTSALALFADNGVEVDAWVAPNHSFDRITVALLGELGVRVISDGFNRKPHLDADGMFWVPCQLHHYVKRQSGVWTMHYHPNYWDDRQTQKFLADLELIAPVATDLDAIRRDYGDRAESASDALYATYRVARSRMRRSTPAGPAVPASTVADSIALDRATA